MLWIVLFATWVYKANPFIKLHKTSEFLHFIIECMFIRQIRTTLQLRLLLSWPGEILNLLNECVLLLILDETERFHFVHLLNWLLNFFFRLIEDESHLSVFLLHCLELEMHWILQDLNWLLHFRVNFLNDLLCFVVSVIALGLICSLVLLESLDTIK